MNAEKLYEMLQNEAAQGRIFDEGGPSRLRVEIAHAANLTSQLPTDRMTTIGHDYGEMGNLAEQLRALTYKKAPIIQSRIKQNLPKLADNKMDPSGNAYSQADQEHHDLTFAVKDDPALVLYVGPPNPKMYDILHSAYHLHPVTVKSIDTREEEWRAILQATPLIGLEGLVTTDAGQAEWAANLDATMLPAITFIGDESDISPNLRQRIATIKTQYSSDVDKMNETLELAIAYQTLANRQRAFRETIKNINDAALSTSEQIYHTIIPHQVEHDTQHVQDLKNARANGNPIALIDKATENLERSMYTLLAIARNDYGLNVGTK